MASQRHANEKHEQTDESKQSFAAGSRWDLFNSERDNADEQAHDG
jgi:hypothetical protein